MDIFVIENNIAKPTPHAIILSPFKEVWERDETPRKEQAIMEFTYIEFVSSIKKSNPFSGYPEDVRGSKVAEAVMNDASYQPDDLVQLCIETYNRMNIDSSPTLRYYQAAVKGAEKTAQFFEELDFSLLTERGQPMYKVTEVTRALKESAGVLTSLSQLKEKVEQELFESTRTRANKTINLFER